MGKGNSSSREIVTTRLLNAPRELVFRALTDPKIVPRWWGPYGFTNTVRKIDVRPGGEWKFTMVGPDGTEYPNKIVYGEVSPERITYAHGDDGEDASFESIITLEKLGDRTRLTMKAIFRTAEERNKAEEKYGAVEGAAQHLSRLEAQLIQMSTDDKRIFSVSREFNATRELVWKALTTPEALKRWWGPKGFEMEARKLELRPGGTFHYHMKGSGMEGYGKFVYREIIEPEKMVYVNSFSDKGEGITRHPLSATWPLEILNVLTLTEKNGKTTFLLRCCPINETGEERRTYEAGFGSMQEGFKGALDQLGEYLEKAKEGDVMGSKGKAGNKESGKPVKEALLTRVYDAPADLVYKAWTEKKMLAKWFGPTVFTTPVCEVDAKVGGEIYLEMESPDGQRFPMRGSFTEVENGRKLVFTNNAYFPGQEDPLIEGVTTVTFEEQGGKTKLTVKASVFRAKKEAAMALEGMNEGWAQSLGKLAKLVEKR